MNRTLRVMGAIFLAGLIAFSAMNLVSITQAETTLQSKNVAKKIEMPHSPPLDFSAVFQKLGYTSDNITTISSDLLYKILSESIANHQYIENASLQITPQSKNLCNVISQPIQSTSKDPQSTSEIDTVTSGTKAVIIAACWDYAGTDYDLTGYMQPQYNNLLSAVQNLGGYNHIYTLTNTADTWANVLSTVQTAFSAGYENIDLYLLGHGGFEPHWIIWPFYYVTESLYCTYDEISYDPGTNTYSNVFSNAFWDYYVGQNSQPFNRDMSSLRLTYVSTCDGWLFKDYVLNRDATYSHNRAIIAANGIQWNDIMKNFMDWYLWDFYQNGHSSYESYNTAYSQITDWGQGRNPPGVPLSYQDTGTAVWK